MSGNGRTRPHYSRVPNDSHRHDPWPFAMAYARRDPSERSQDSDQDDDEPQTAHPDDDRSALALPSHKPPLTLTYNAGKKVELSQEERASRKGR